MKRHQLTNWSSPIQTIPWFTDMPFLPLVLSTDWQINLLHKNHENCVKIAETIGSKMSSRHSLSHGWKLPFMSHIQKSFWTVVSSPVLPINFLLTLGPSQVVGESRHWGCKGQSPVKCSNSVDLYICPQVMWSPQVSLRITWMRRMCCNVPTVQERWLPSTLPTTSWRSSSWRAHSSWLIKRCRGLWQQPMLVSERGRGKVAVKMVVEWWRSWVGDCGFSLGILPWSSILLCSTEVRFQCHIKG